MPLTVVKQSPKSKTKVLEWRLNFEDEVFSCWAGGSMKMKISLISQAPTCGWTVDGSDSHHGISRSEALRTFRLP